MLKKTPPRVPRPDPAERILAAAIELFAAEGYASVAVPEIAAQAGVGLGTLYQRFSSKEALGNAVFRHCKRAWAEATLDVWPDDEPPEAQFRTYWRRICDFAECHRDMALYNERNPIGHAFDAESLALREELDRRSRAALRGWAEAGAIADLPFEVMAAMIHGPFQRILELRIEPGDRVALMRATGEAVWKSLAVSRPQ
ncbi:TetR/AcrR family transcriptional regulator [Parvibaculum sp.]|jgi:AcrR family transcriptional regulator|uniref:TetR/AcrR family transcriptional regulator n=1 Tax=Parvibaculum sp. TaxID=2024848 RepID=UPI003266C88A